MNEPLRVAGYLRADGGGNTAVDEDTRLFEERLKSHAGWECAGIYADNAPGGKGSPRPNLTRLVADCEAGKINLIVTNSLSTLYEDTSESLQFVWEMQMLSPPVHIRLEEAGIDTRNPQALLYCMVFNYVIQEKRERAEHARQEQEATENG
jgi:DNA invertase Pin-like site-specific DNA recombinase